MVNVLLVDDSLDQSRALMALMRYGGIDIHYVESGAAAFAFLEQHPIHVVLLDAMMPDVSGWEVLRTIRLQPRFDAIHVLMYSAVDDPQWTIKAHEMGASEYLVKTKITFSELRTIVQRYLAAPRIASAPRAAKES